MAARPCAFADWKLRAGRYDIRKFADTERAPTRVCQLYGSIPLVLRVVGQVLCERVFVCERPMNASLP